MAALRNNPMTPEKAIAFLEEAACYFERRSTKGEDRAHWSNVFNAESCRLIAAMVKEFSSEPAGER